MVKILQLYDLEHKKIDGLVNYKELKIEREVNVDDTLYFSYPNSDSKHDLIQEECYIRTKENEYVVKEINVGDDWTDIICKVNLENIKGNYVNSFETVEQTCTNAVNLALVGTGWTIGSCDVSKLRTTRKSNSTSYVILQEIQSTYDCEMTFDSMNKKVYIYQSMGSDKGTYFSEQLNLKKLDVQRNSYDYITRIIPAGKDGLDISSVNGGKNYVENHQYSSKVITAYWEDNRYTVAQDLLEDAISRLEYLSKPYRAYKADVIDLASINTKYSVLDYSVGDTITLLSKSKNTKEKQRIIKLTEYPEEPERNTVEIANKILRLEDLQIKFVEASDVVESITTSDGGVDGSKVDSIDASQIQNLDVAVASIANLTAINATIVNLTATKANIGELNAAIARIGTLEVTTATITQLNATNASIVNLTATTATIVNLNASNARIGTLEATTATINTLLAGNIGAANIATGAITAGSGIIANLAIGDAQISTINAGKLVAGTVDTSKVTIQGANGRLKITGNRLQVFAGTTTLYERVSVGDVNGDGTVYGLRVRGSDGTTILIDETGVKHEGITDGAITNSKISTDAAIDGTKIDIASVVTEINAGTTTISGSKVFLNNSTLDVQFSALNTTVGDQGTTISSQTGSISALSNAISLKVATQTYTTKTTALDGSITNINTSLGVQSSSIAVLQSAIVLKVTQTDVDTSINKIQIGGRNLLRGSRDFTIAGYGYTKDTEVYQGFLVAVGAPSTGYKDTVTVTTPVLDELEYTASFFAKSTNATQNIVCHFYSPNTTTNATSSTGQTSTASDGGCSVTITNVWKRYWVSWKQSIGGSVKRLIFARVTASGDAYVAGVQFEKGNKATDWSPAPEDVQGQIDGATTRISNAESTLDLIPGQFALKATTASLTTTNDNLGKVTTRMSNAESSITAQAGQISLKASQTSLNTTNTNVTNAQGTANSANGTANALQNTIVPALTTRMVSAESAITINSNAIGLKVTQAQVDTTVNAIQIGGRNYFKKSTGIALYNGAVCDRTNIECINGMYTVGASAHTSIIRMQGVITCNGPWTVSFEFRGSQSSPVGFLVSFCDLAAYQETTTADNTWTKISVTSNITNFSAIYNFIDFRNLSWAYIFIRNIKIEQGTKATDWSPAPEDVQGQLDSATTRLNTAESTLDLLPGQFALKASQTSLNTTNSNVSGVTTRMTSAESSISAQAGQITLKASQTSLNTTNSNLSGVTTRMSSVEGSISIQAAQIASKVNVGDFGTLITQNTSSVKIAVGNIGGNNLIKNSIFNYGTASWITNGYPIINTVEARIWIGYGRNTAYIQGNGASFGYFQPFPTIIGVKYTVSFMACINTQANIGHTQIGIESVWGVNVLNLTNHTFYEYTFTASSSSHAFVAYANGGAGFFLSDVQVVEGDKKTAWSPNPDELQTASFEVTDEHARFTGVNGSYTEFVPGSTGLKWHQNTSSGARDYHYLLYKGSVSNVDSLTTVRITLPTEFRGKDYLLSWWAGNVFPKNPGDLLYSANAELTAENKSEGWFEVKASMMCRNPDTEGSPSWKGKMNILYMVVA